MPELDPMKRRLTWMVGARGGEGLQPDAAARPLDRTRVPRIARGECTQITYIGVNQW